MIIYPLKRALSARIGDHNNDYDFDLIWDYHIKDYDYRLYITLDYNNYNDNIHYMIMIIIIQN